MMTAYEEQVLIDKIKGLTELEFSAILREMAQHIRRNNWESMIDDCFDIETFEDELEEMRESREKYFERARKAEEIIEKIKDII